MTQNNNQLRKRDLAQFTGTLNYWRDPNSLYPFIYTDGVRYLARQGSAFWLLDAIASWQANCTVRSDLMLCEHQFWMLKVNQDKSAELICERDKGDVAVTQRIEFTDFPLSEIRLYLCNMGRYWESVLKKKLQAKPLYGVLLLPSEY